MILKVVNEEFLQNRSYENEILKNISKKRVFAALKQNGFNPEELLHVKKTNSKLSRKFNTALRKTSLYTKINMHEIILLLEEDHTTLNFLMASLNDRNKDIIRNECKIKYNINDDDCILFEILSY